MKSVLLMVAAAALVGTMLPALLYLAGQVSKDSMQWFMLAATIIWFAVVPFCNRGATRTAQHGPRDAD